MVFDFKNARLAGHDFSCPSDADWHELLKQSCQRLRDENRYLALWYSGGSDSLTILNTFKRHGIPLDEIVFYDKKYQPYPYYDTERRCVLDDIAGFCQTQPRCQVTVLDVDYQSARQFYLRHGEDWIYQPFVTYRFSKNMRYNLLDRHPHDRDRLTAPGVLNIHGSDPSKLFLDNNQWHLTFFDTQEMDTYLLNFHNFYWDDLDILCKQSHMAVDRLRSMPGVDNELVQRFQRHEPLIPYRDWISALGRDVPKDEYISSGVQKLGLSREHATYECSNMEEYARQHDPEVYAIYNAGITVFKESGYQNQFSRLHRIKDHA